MWMTLGIWLGITIILSGVAPAAKQFESTVSGEGLPATAQSMIAEQKLETYFSTDEGMPALLVISQEDETLPISSVADAIAAIDEAQLTYVNTVIPFHQLPPMAQQAFISDDGTTAVIPIMLTPHTEVKHVEATLEEIEAIALAETAAPFIRITGPAGIATDTVNLFLRADVVLLLTTIGIIFVLLIIIYRSPLLVFIPLLACAFIYAIVDRVLGLMGQAGLELNSQSLSIMTILLFASVTDYSLFIFSRFREELKHVDDKFAAMKLAMRGTGEPVFFSGGTILAAMLVLFVAALKDYRDFAPVFATAMAIIMLASITFIPALFQLFGRRSFWPKVPQVGDPVMKETSIWSKVGRLVSGRPKIMATALIVLFVVMGLNVFNINFQFDAIQSFPKNMPSREGYEKLEQYFPKGDLAPTTVILEANKPVPDEVLDALIEQFAQYEEVAQIRVNGTAADGAMVKFNLTFNDSPYAINTLEALERIRSDAPDLLASAGLTGERSAELSGDLHFAGETAKQVDIRIVNARDTLLIVIFETLLILLLLWVLTRSLKSASYMMATILISYAAALGLGLFLIDVLFGYEAINTRVPIYAFVFLVALGIDYNIMLMSRFQEERKKYALREAVQRAVSRTGGVISSAGIILAATFAVLMTMPIAELFVFGFIVALGILMDVFLVRGMLLPALMMLLEGRGKSVKTGGLGTESGN